MQAQTCSNSLPTHFLKGYPRIAKYAIGKPASCWDVAVLAYSLPNSPIGTVETARFPRVGLPYNICFRNSLSSEEKSLGTHSRNYRTSIGPSTGYAML